MEKFKKFLNYFNMFEIDLTRRSYKSPLIRIFASLLVVFIILAIRLNITIANPVVNIVTLVIMLAIIILCILCFFIASVECLQVGDNKRKDKERANSKYK